MIDLSKLHEEDVIDVFRQGLERFVQSAGGRFYSRRVSLRDEKDYPSDRDFSILFQEKLAFSIHMFGLQFKRWSSECWRIANGKKKDPKVAEHDQLGRLKRMNHVVAYCLPLPFVTDADNSLHYYIFLNPAHVPNTAIRLRLQHNALLTSTCYNTDRISKECRSRLVRDAQQILEYWKSLSPLDRRIRSREGKPALANLLLDVVLNSESTIKSVMEDELLRLVVLDTRNWGMQIHVDEIESSNLSNTVPHCSWAEFFLS